MEKPWVRIAVVIEGEPFVVLRPAIELEGQPSSLAAADLDGDGDADLAVLSSPEERITVFFTVEAARSIGVTVTPADPRLDSLKRQT